MKNLTKKILVEVFKSSNGLYTYTLYRRFLSSPKELFVSLSELSDLGLAHEEDERISLTKKGLNFVINNNILFQKNESKYSKIPNKYLGRKIEINEFYLPRLNDSVNEIFNFEEL